MLRFSAAAILWIAFALGAAGLLNAKLRADYPNQDARQAREDCGFALGVGMLGGPLTFIEAALFTGFGASGWTLECARVHTLASAQ
jgi:hypothetical protein